MLGNLCGWWTWKMRERRSVVDNILVKGLVMNRVVVEDNEDLNLGSGHNLMWCVVRRERKRVLQI